MNDERGECRSFDEAEMFRPLHRSDAGGVIAVDTNRPSQSASLPHRQWTHVYHACCWLEIGLNKDETK